MADVTTGSVRRTTAPVREALRRQRDIRVPAVTAVVVGVGVGVLATAARLAFNELVGGDTGYFLTLAAAVLAAWYTGLVGGVVAALVTVLLALPAILTGAPAGETDRAELVRLALYLAIATATVTLVAGRRAATIRLEDASLEVAHLAEKVAARDARLEMMLAASGTGFWEWDLTTNELEWSDAIFEQHGLEAGGTAPGFDAYLDMIHPDDRATFRDAIGAALEHGDGFTLEFRVIWPDGSVHWTHGAGRIVRDASGRPARMLGTGQDITDRRQAEADRDRLVDDERRAGEFREAFVEVISHELRTPITTILGLTHVLVQQQQLLDDAARTALLEDVRAESERLHRLVEDLLVLSRVERGRLRVEAEPLMPARMLERVVAREASELPSLAIELRIEPRLPIVSGEETYVEQIVRNLLGNAAKYAPAGTRVVVDARRDDGGAAAIRVLDEGPGISDASLDRVFELFYRDPDSARSVSGSGIGLFVCASLVEAMGGRIWARRRPEGGSEIGFTLPPFEVDDDAAAPAATESAAIPTSGA
ncbi:MAG TPA: ATP-binding protein [Candidatus Limnocylindrales bacterium]